ncbi:MAG: ankyrin repeat domain-containing protein [Kiritimatiellia bacterium]
MRKNRNWLFGKNGAFFSACVKGKLELAGELLKEGADVNILSQSGVTPLHRAAQYGNTETVRFLIDNGADPSIAPPGIGTPADIAEKNNQTEVLKLLKPEHR